MAKKKKKIQPGLGKGLSALLPSVEYSKEKKAFKLGEKDEEKLDGGTIALVEVKKVRKNPYQPRREFDQQALEDLKNSILQHGVIQPITVRRSINGYELVAGERRLRATELGGLEKIPAYVLDVENGVDMLEIALIENLLREDLNPIEIANGYQRLIDECKCTQEEVASKVSRDRATVANFIRLLRLPGKIQDYLRTKEMSMGHARALLGLSNKEQMLRAGEKVIKEKMTVRHTEKMVKEIEAGKIKILPSGKISKIEMQKPKSPVSEDVILALEDKSNKLRHIYGTKINIKPKTEESGNIVIEFYSKDDLERLYELLSSIEIS